MQSAAIVIVLYAVAYVSGEFLKEMFIFTYKFVKHNVKLELFVIFRHRMI